MHLSAMRSLLQLGGERRPNIMAICTLRSVSCKWLAASGQSAFPEEGIAVPGHSAMVEDETLWSSSESDKNRFWLAVEPPE